MRFYFSACLFGLGLFLAFPQLDLAFSGLFYRPESGFTHQDLPWVQALYWWFARLQFPILIALVVGLLAAYLRSPWARHRAGLWFLLLALFLGPGLVVNELLKKHWGRARPVQVTEFGGQAQYTPPWQITDQCPRNCSFSSGHAALGFYPMALGWLGRIKGNSATCCSVSATLGFRPCLRSAAMLPISISDSSCSELDSNSGEGVGL